MNGLGAFATAVLNFCKAVFLPELRKAIKRKREQARRQKERAECKAYREKLEAFWAAHFARVEEMKKRNAERWKRERPSAAMLGENPYDVEVH